MPTLVPMHLRLRRYSQCQTVRTWFKAFSPLTGHSRRRRFYKITSACRQLSISIGVNRRHNIACAVITSLIRTTHVELVRVKLEAYCESDL